MAGDGVELALAARLADAWGIYTRGLDEARIFSVARHDRTTIGRWFRTGKPNMAALLRLNAYFATMGRPGFLAAVADEPSLAQAAWRAAPCDLEQLTDPAYRLLLEKSGQVGVNARELLVQCGLLERAHIILLRDTDAISIHIGSGTVVSQDLFGLDIRNRKNKSYAELIFDHVSVARAGAVLHQLDDDQGNGYRSLRLPFRSGPTAPVEIVTLPHAIVSATNYLVR